MLMLLVSRLLFAFVFIPYCVNNLQYLSVIYAMPACDVPGIKRLLPSEWREQEFFNNIYELVGVPVVTVQLRYNGWVTELQDLEKSR